MRWNTNISEAPKSYYTLEKALESDGTPKLSKSGKPIERRVFHKVPIWVAYEGVSGPTTGTTYWRPDTERWEGFTKEEGLTAHGFIALPSYADFQASTSEAVA